MNIGRLSCRTSMGVLGSCQHWCCYDGCLPYFVVCLLRFCRAVSPQKALHDHVIHALLVVLTVMVTFSALVGMFNIVGRACCLLSRVWVKWCVKKVEVSGCRSSLSYLTSWGSIVQLEVCLRLRWLGMH